MTAPTFTEEKTVVLAQVDRALVLDYGSWECFGELVLDLGWYESCVAVDGMGGK